jgi:hypothetical protein
MTYDYELVKKIVRTFAIEIRNVYNSKENIKRPSAGLELSESVRYLHLNHMLSSVRLNISEIYVKNVLFFPQ